MVRDLFNSFWMAPAESKSSSIVSWMAPSWPENSLILLQFALKPLKKRPVWFPLNRDIYIYNNNNFIIILLYYY